LAWAEIIGQYHAKRAGEVALAGGHSLFLYGVRGSQIEDLAAWVRQQGGQAGAAWVCPCGCYGDHHHACTCSVRLIVRHQKKMWPERGAIDIWCELPRVDPITVDGWMKHGGEPWANVQARIDAARARAPLPEYQDKILDAAGMSLLGAFQRQLGPGGDEIVRMLAVARTIATLAGEKTIQTAHLAEAMQYRYRSDF
jgi:magnesium chelatase family protein